MRPFTAIVTSVFSFAVLAAATAQGLTLDWNAVTWAPGSLSNSYNFGTSTITITITGNTNKLTTDPATGVQTPTINNTLEGGFGGDSSLHIAGNLSTQTDFKVTVTFTGQYYGATDVSFTLFDIDEGASHEQIVNNFAIGADGTTQIAPNITNLGPNVALSGTGLNQVLTGNGAVANTGATSGSGNATIDFGTTAINSFSFDFKNNAGAPFYQEIALFDISFTPVPEVNPAWFGGLSCLAAGLLIHRHNARLRK